MSRYIKNALVVMALVAGSAAAQMSTEQRLSDFTYLTSLLNRNYAPYEWKKQALGVDMLDTQPWLDRVRAAKSDAEFLDLCVEYMSALKDYNTFLEFPSDFEAYLGFTADLYDGKAIVESIDRVQLPSSRYPLAIGDEIVSVDGKVVSDWISELSRFVVDGNPSATRRGALDFLTYRIQSYMPRAADLGSTARVVFRRSSDGTLVTLDLPWDKLGTPMQVGPVPGFKSAPKASAVSATPFYQRLLNGMDHGAKTRRIARKVSTPEAVESASPEIQGIGSVLPLFTLPANFQTRLGRGRTDLIFTGVYEAGGKRIGFLRIPAFSTSTALLAQLDTEITWLNDNTDVLVLDQMRDRLQSICSAERVAARFIGRPFRQPGFEVRATWTNVVNFETALDDALFFGADPDTVASLEVILKDLRTAYSETRGRTGPLPFCGERIDRLPVADRTGRIITYDKPILLVTDEFSSDFFAATLKDAGKAKQFGMPTRGVLGTGTVVPGPAFSETTVYIKDSLMTRAAPASSSGFPDSVYVENAGVYPEFLQDYMTIDNYRQRGVPFVQEFTRVALSLLQ